MRTIAPDSGFRAPDVIAGSDADQAGTLERVS
jgi:hypothetical protein